MRKQAGTGTGTRVALLRNTFKKKRELFRVRRYSGDFCSHESHPGVTPGAARGPPRPLEPRAMPRYYCEYCDISLTHSSVPGRKQHHSGRKHIMNFIEYWAAFQTAVPAPQGRPAMDANRRTPMPPSGPPPRMPQPPSGPAPPGGGPRPPPGPYPPRPPPGMPPLPGMPPMPPRPGMPPIAPYPGMMPGQYPPAGYPPAGFPPQPPGGYPPR